MTTIGDIDLLVHRAQGGDREALEQVLAASYGPLRRFARGLGGTGVDHEDVVQEALLDVARGIRGYRWEASFLSWAYAICARRVARAVRAAERDLAMLAERLEESVSGPGDPLEQHEQFLAVQDAHLACAMVVALDLSTVLRRAYLLGDVLGVQDRVGAEICGCTPAAFRQRVSRARRIVRHRIRDRLVAEGSVLASPDLAAELDRLVRLGDLRRGVGREVGPEAAARAASIAAPSLMAADSH